MDKQTLANILRSLYFQPTQSITELSNRVGKSVPFVTKSLQHLIDQQLVCSLGLGASTGGRRANNYALNLAKLPYMLVLSIDQYQSTITLLDFANNFIKNTAHLDMAIMEENSNIEDLLIFIENYLVDLNKDDIALLAVSMPGFVDATSGVNISFSEKCSKRNLKERLKQHFNFPTYLENDSTAIAIAEHQFGIAKHSKNALIINLNWGVGLGIIIDSKLYKGHSGFAGEFSHIPISNQNKLCSCGKKGCLEVEASLLTAINIAKSKLQKGEVTNLPKSWAIQKKRVQIQELIDYALQGDQMALSCFSSIAYILGKGIATLIHIVNPEKIIISGKGAQMGTILMPHIESSLLEYSISQLSKHTKIKFSKLQNMQILGTAAVAISAYNWNKMINKNKLTKHSI
ncbi:MAG TPA: ROK family protein [Candidatus Sphingobacterium stercoripullorum]|uniref:ROK family protein n=1 Tax=Candidatus Sphingobacterium stercoripullorum TaxID=2838759 RepID=A0A9D2AZV8_9SPHI|nr:ROK family protein [Candidatus Sphingobacterium stercoripullorum]HLR51116.1 ROK family protein [Candidatus Sphingobacterium stercoripullorum]